MTSNITHDASWDTLPKLFHSKINSYGDRAAMREKVLGIWQEISWNQYGQHVKHLGTALHNLGVKKGHCIAIISDPNPEWLYCDMAIQCLGGISVGIYTTNSAEEVEYIIDHSESKYVFVENEEQLDKVLQKRKNLPRLSKIIVFDMEGLRDFKDPMVMSFKALMTLGKKRCDKNPGLFDTLWPQVTPRDTAIIVYTSGTTGPPKGAMRTHHNAVWTTRSLAQTNKVYDTDEILSFLPLCHVAERLNTVFSPLVNGQIINFAENMETVPENIREISPHVFFAVPRIWEKFYSSVILQLKESTWLEKKVFNWSMKVGEAFSQYKLNTGKVPLWTRIKAVVADFLVFKNTRRLLGLDRGRFVFSGGAPISSDILKFFHTIGVRVREVYGQTELTGPATIHPGNDIKLGTVGKPIPGTEVKLGDDGEILVKGPHVFQAYFKAPDLTADTIKDGWLHTGDIGKFDADGNLVITDRKKDIIITSGGKNVTPQYIENKLKFSPYINDSVVIGDRRKFLTSLVMIDKENVTQYAQDERIPFTTYKSLCQNEQIIELIQAEINEINKSLAKVETIKKFCLIDVELTSDDPELTATMKLKRKFINERFSEMIESMYH